MKCCANCFSDSFLSLRIAAISNERGKCSYCKSENTPVVDPSALIDYLSPLLEIYDVAVDGRPLNTLLQEDWGLFSFTKETQQKRLLEKITRNPDLATLKFAPVYAKDKENIKKWYVFTQELKYKNRFLPDYAPKTDLFEKFGRFLGVIVEKDTQKFYRARINDSDTSYKLKELKKPPAAKAMNGRANPLGIAYLYTASTSDTAIAEVRAHKGEHVAVLEFDVKNSLDLYDLREPKNSISPFEWSEEIEFIYRHMPYFELLGNELSKPIIPRNASLDYLPLQYICEIIKKIGYHGIIYKSSIAGGNNYVVFADNRLKPGSIHEYKIIDMEFKTAKIY